MATNATTKTRTKATEITNVKMEAYKVMATATTAVSSLIGLWAVACFVGGMVAAGGPLRMAKSWFQALTGM